MWTTSDVQRGRGHHQEVREAQEHHQVVPEGSFDLVEEAQDEFPTFAVNPDFYLTVVIRGAVWRLRRFARGLRSSGSASGAP